MRFELKKDRLYIQAMNEEKNRQKNSKEIIKCITYNNVVAFLKNNMINGYNLNRCLCNNEFNSNSSYRRKYINKLFKKIHNALKKHLKFNTVNEEDCKIYRNNFASLLLLLETFSSQGLLKSNNSEMSAKYMDIKFDLEKKLCNIEKKHAKEAIKLKQIEKSKSNICNNYGYIYLIRTRACINANENVYKVGKTRNEIKKRMTGYDKGYNIIYVKRVGNNLDSLENRIISELKEFTTIRRDYGREYFEGDPCYITKLIDKIIDEFVD